MPFAGWITGIAINTFLADILLKGVAKEQPDLSNVFPKSYNQNRFEEILLVMPGNEKYIIIFNLIEGYSLKETSDFLGLSYKETKRLLDTALKKICASFDLYYTPDQAADKIKSLPDKIEPPKEVWNKIVFELMKEKSEVHEKLEKQLEEELKEVTVEDKPEKKVIKEEKKKEKPKRNKKENVIKIPSQRRRLKYFPVKRTVIIILLLVTAATIYFFFMVSITKWTVTSTAGMVKINEGITYAGASLDESDLISCKNNSTYTISIENAGKIEASENTSIQRLGESKINFSKGKIKVTRHNAPEFLSIVVPSAEINNLYPGGEYDVEVIPGEVAVVSNFKSWLEVKSNLLQLLIPPGYRCEIRPDTGPGVPYNTATSDYIKSLIHSFNFSGTDINETLNQILLSSEKKDAFSLWNMIKVVSPMRRGEIYETLTRMINIPKSVTKEGIIYLNDKMMDELFAALKREPESR